MRFCVSSSEAEASADEASLPPLRFSRAGEPSSSKSRRAPVTGQARASSSDLFQDAEPSAVSPAAGKSNAKAPTRTRPRQFVPPWIKASQRQSRSSIRLPGNDSDASDEEEEHNQTIVLSKQKQTTSLRSGSRAFLQRRSVSFRATAESSPSLSSSSDNWNATTSSDDDDDDDDDGDAGSYPDTSDSEEIDWPVAPGRLGRRRSGPAKSRLPLGSKGKEKEVLRSIKLAADAEEWEEEWVDVMRKNGRSWAEHMARARSRSTAQPKRNVDKALADDFDDVQAVLSRLKLEKEGTERKEREEFEARQQKLWNSIEAAIKAAEDEARKRAKEEADRLEAARKAQEDAERRAKEAREAEQRKIQEEEEAKKRAAAAEEERKRQASEDQKKAEEEAKAQEATRGMGGGAAVHGKAREEYTKWSEKIREIKEQVLPAVSGNTVWRKQCFAAKRQITPKIGQLTNSRQEIMRITSTLSNLLNEARAAPAPNGEIYIWVLNHLSKCLIRQAEQEVAVKADTAYPLARVVVWLLLEGHQQLAEVLMARLVKKSCWCLGFVPPRKADQDEASYSKTIGRASPEETSVQFTSRQAGILAFYFAICQMVPDLPPSKQSQMGFGGQSAQQSNGLAEQIPAHFRPSALWAWQARCVTPPMTNHAIVPALWGTLIDVAGPRLLQCYGRQVSKIWRLLYQEGIMAGKAGFVSLDEGKAASGRLQLLLEDWSKAGVVTPLKGREMDA